MRIEEVFNDSEDNKSDTKKEDEPPLLVLRVAQKINKNISRGIFVDIRKRDVRLNFCSHNNFAKDLRAITIAKLPVEELKKGDRIGIGVDFFEERFCIMWNNSPIVGNYSKDGTLPLHLLFGSDDNLSYNGGLFSDGRDSNGAGARLLEKCGNECLVPGVILNSQLKERLSFSFHNEFKCIGKKMNRVRFGQSFFRLGEGDKSSVRSSCLFCDVLIEQSENIQKDNNESEYKDGESKEMEEKEENVKTRSIGKILIAEGKHSLTLPFEDSEVCLTNGKITFLIPSNISSKWSLQHIELLGTALPEKIIVSNGKDKSDSWQCTLCNSLNPETLMECATCSQVRLTGNLATKMKHLGRPLISTKFDDHVASVVDEMEIASNMSVSAYSFPFLHTYEPSTIRGKFFDSEEEDFIVPLIGLGHLLPHRGGSNLTSNNRRFGSSIVPTDDKKVDQDEVHFKSWVGAMALVDNSSSDRRCIISYQFNDGEYRVLTSYQMQEPIEPTNDADLLTCMLEPGAQTAEFAKWINRSKTTDLELFKKIALNEPSVPVDWILEGIPKGEKDWKVLHRVSNHKFERNDKGKKEESAAQRITRLWNEQLFKNRNGKFENQLKNNFSVFVLPEEARFACNRFRLVITKTSLSSTKWNGNLVWPHVQVRNLLFWVKKENVSKQKKNEVTSKKWKATKMLYPYGEEMGILGKEFMWCRDLDDYDVAMNDFYRFNREIRQCFVPKLVKNVQIKKFFSRESFKRLSKLSLPPQLIQFGSLHYNDMLDMIQWQFYENSKVQTFSRMYSLKNENGIKIKIKENDVNLKLRYHCGIFFTKEKNLFLCSAPTDFTEEEVKRMFYTKFMQCDSCKKVSERSFGKNNRIAWVENKNLNTKILNQKIFPSISVDRATLLSPGMLASEVLQRSIASLSIDNHFVDSEFLANSLYIWGKTHMPGNANELAKDDNVIRLDGLPIQMLWAVISRGHGIYNDLCTIRWRRSAHLPNRLEKLSQFRDCFDSRIYSRMDYMKKAVKHLTINDKKLSTWIDDLKGRSLIFPKFMIFPNSGCWYFEVILKKSCDIKIGWTIRNRNGKSNDKFYGWYRGYCDVKEGIGLPEPQRNTSALSSLYNLNGEIEETLQRRVGDLYPTSSSPAAARALYDLSIPKRGELKVDIDIKKTVENFSSSLLRSDLATIEDELVCASQRCAKCLLCEPSFYENDTIGCWLDTENGEIGYTLNGHRLGTAFYFNEKEIQKFCPAISLPNKIIKKDTQSVLWNFGNVDDFPFLLREKNVRIPFQRISDAKSELEEVKYNFDNASSANDSGNILNLTSNFKSETNETESSSLSSTTDNEKENNSSTIELVKPYKFKTLKNKNLDREKSLLLYKKNKIYTAPKCPVENKHFMKPRNGSAGSWSCKICNRNNDTMNRLNNTSYYYWQCASCQVQICFGCERPPEEYLLAPFDNRGKITDTRKVYIDDFLMEQYRNICITSPWEYGDLPTLLSSFQENSSSKSNEEHACHPNRLKAKGLSRLAKEVLISPCRRPFQIGSLVRCLATNGEWRVMIVDKVTRTHIQVQCGSSKSNQHWISRKCEISDENYQRKGYSFFDTNEPHFGVVTSIKEFTIVDVGKSSNTLNLYSIEMNYRNGESKHCVRHSDRLVAIAVKDVVATSRKDKGSLQRNCDLSQEHCITAIRINPDSSQGGMIARRKTPKTMLGKNRLILAPLRPTLFCEALTSSIKDRNPTCQFTIADEFSVETFNTKFDIRQVKSSNVDNYMELGSEISSPPLPPTLDIGIKETRIHSNSFAFAPIGRQIVDFKFSEENGSLESFTTIPIPDLVPLKIDLHPLASLVNKGSAMEPISCESDRCCLEISPQTKVNTFPSKVSLPGGLRLEGILFREKKRSEYAFTFKTTDELCMFSWSCGYSSIAFDIDITVNANDIKFSSEKYAGRVSGWQAADGIWPPENVDIQTHFVKNVNDLENKSHKSKKVVVPRLLKGGPIERCFRQGFDVIDDLVIVRSHEIDYKRKDMNIFGKGAKRDPAERYGLTIGFPTLAKADGHWYFELQVISGEPPYDSVMHPFLNPFGYENVGRRKVNKYNKGVRCTARTNPLDFYPDSNIKIGWCELNKFECSSEEWIDEGRQFAKNGTLGVGDCPHSWGYSSTVRKPGLYGTTKGRLLHNKLELSPSQQERLKHWKNYGSNPYCNNTIGVELEFSKFSKPKMKFFMNGKIMVPVDTKLGDFVPKGAFLFPAFTLRNGVYSWNLGQKPFFRDMKTTTAKGLIESDEIPDIMSGLFPYGSELQNSRDNQRK
eukprot:g1997.t1